MIREVLKLLLTMRAPFLALGKLLELHFALLEGSWGALAVLFGSFWSLLGGSWRLFVSLWPSGSLWERFWNLRERFSSEFGEILEAPGPQKTLQSAVLSALFAVFVFFQKNPGGWGVTPNPPSDPEIRVFWKNRNPRDLLE